MTKSSRFLLLRDDYSSLGVFAIVSSVKKNYIYISIYQLLIILVPLLTSPYIARKLGPEMLGVESYYYSIATYFYLFVMLGVNNYGNRSIALHRDNNNLVSETFWSIYGFQFLRGIVVFSLYIVFVFLFQKDNLKIALINGLYIISGLLEIAWFFLGIGEGKIIAKINILIKILSVFFIFIFIKNVNDLWLYAIILTGSSVISNLLLWTKISKYICYYKPKISEFKKHIKPEFVLFIPIIFISIYKVMDKIMLGIMTTNVQVGYYTNADSLVSIPLGLITALGTVMMPHTANLLSKGMVSESLKNIEATIDFSILISSPMCFGMIGIAPLFVPLFWGVDFVPASEIIVGLAPSIVLISWSNVIRSQYLIPRMKERIISISCALGALVNLVLNLFFIPIWQSMGAVYGTIATEIIVCFIQTYYVRKDLDIIGYLKQCFPIILISVFMMILVRFLIQIWPNNVITLILVIVLAVLFYCIFGVLFILTTKKEGWKRLKIIILNEICYRRKMNV